MESSVRAIEQLRSDAMTMITDSVEAVLPFDAVKTVLAERSFERPVTLVAIGKAAWMMASAAADHLGDSLAGGIVLTKEGHLQGPIAKLDLFEAGHPIPDEAGVRATQQIIELATHLTADDQLLLLLSGGGSALFESPVEGVELGEIIDLTDQLLSSGADIVEINTVRKRLSRVKGGRFAELCAPAEILAIVLSDVIGNRVDAIASGPVSPDRSTSAEALRVVERYELQIGAGVRAALERETPKAIGNSETIIAGSVDHLCEAAAASARRLGYHPLVLTSYLECEAREAGRYMAALAKEVVKSGERPYGVERPCALIAGGETVVRVTGVGTGGRNQELALSAAIDIAGLEEVVIGSVGSDGTDGPTDAAGGLVDGGTAARIAAAGVEPEVYLDNNDSYNALRQSADLVMTGPTGTNVNDLVFLLCR